MKLRVRHVATMLPLLAVSVAWVVMPARPERPGPRPPVAASRPAPRRPDAATAGQILARAQTLGLRPEQRARLAVLDRAWREESEMLEAALRTATEEFSRFMEESRRTRGVSLAEIRGRSADAGELGGLLRERRRVHTAVAATVLDTEQRALLVAVEPSVAERGSP